MRDKLFEPIQIGSITVKNRLQLSAMGTKYVDIDGICNERLAQYYITRAKGGWGLIVTEMCKVSDDSQRNIIGMYNEEQVKAFKPVLEEIHQYGTKMLLQIMHPGRRDNSQLRKEGPGLAPTSIPIAPNAEIPHELTTTEVWQIIQQFIYSASLAQKAGFDGVEVHCGHGWLLSSFMSPISNKRADEFGGSIKNRCKIVTEIIKGIKEHCGKEFVVTAKISTDEYVDAGIGIEEAKVMAWLLEKAGVDALHCTQGIFLSNHVTNPPSCTPRGYYVNNAREIKKAVSIPVIAVGRINDPDLAECLLEMGGVDMISMARASLADPDFPNKVAENREEDIIRCVGCLQMCLGAKKGEGISCMLNPMTGREWKYLGKKTSNKKLVYVAGGGVAGCEAAIAAAEQGHNVVLFEATDTLGGQWLAARMPVGKEEFGSFLRWQSRRLEQLSVEIRFDTPMTRQIVEDEKPDNVIIATGGYQFIPPIKGATEENVVLPNDILLGKKTAGKNVLIIGGGLVGAELADHLAFYGSRVTIVEMMDSIAREAQQNVRTKLLERLEKRQVMMLTNSKLVELGANKAYIERLNEIVELDYIDTIVMAVGTKSNNKLVEELEGVQAAVTVVGDAAKAKIGSDNITEAFLAGYSI